MFRRLLASVLLLLVVSEGMASHGYAQSGFVRPPRSVYTKLSYSFFTSHDYYDLVGNLNDRGEQFYQHSVHLYGEVGIVPGLNAILNAPLVRVNRYANTGRAAGIGDLQLGLKYGLDLFAGLKLAATVAVDFPTGNSDAVVQTDTGANLLLPTGDGEFNVWTILALSRSIEPIHGWFNTYFGVNARTSGLSHQLQFGVEVGTFLFDAIYAQARFRGQFVPSDDLNVAGGFIYAEGTEYLSIGLGLAYPIPRTPIAVTLDWEQAIAQQQNLYAGPVISVGVSYEWTPPSQ